MFVNPNVNERLEIIFSIKKAIPHPVESEIDIQGTNIDMAYIYPSGVADPNKYIRIVFFEDGDLQITVEQMTSEMHYIANVYTKECALMVAKLDLSYIFTGSDGDYMTDDPLFDTFFLSSYSRV
jgi:hypothetical protein